MSFWSLSRSSSRCHLPCVRQERDERHGRSIVRVREKVAVRLVDLLDRGYAYQAQRAQHEAGLIAPLDAADFRVRGYGLGSDCGDVTRATTRGEGAAYFVRFMSIKD
jgi:hypothetical protein